jgi:hypothetical protein
VLESGHFTEAHPLRTLAIAALAATLSPLPASAGGEDPAAVAILQQAAATCFKGKEYRLVYERSPNQDPGRDWHHLTLHFQIEYGGGSRSEQFSRNDVPELDRVVETFSLAKYGDAQVAPCLRPFLERFLAKIGG